MLFVSISTVITTCQFAHKRAQSEYYDKNVLTTTVNIAKVCCSLVNSTDDHYTI